MDSAEHNDAKETAAGYQVESAVREVEAGNREKASAEANAALKLAPNRDVKSTAALALARAGDSAGAEKLVEELDKAFPLDVPTHRVAADDSGRRRNGAQRPEPGCGTSEGDERD